MLVFQFRMECVDANAGEEGRSANTQAGHASSIGIEDRIEPVSDRRYLLPDGSTRFLVDEQMLLDLSDRLGATLLDPIKTTNVQGQRCMTTWCVAKTA